MPCRTKLQPNLLHVYQTSYKTNITSNNGYLGSRNDEDRSEFRYLMRIAELANHQTVERILHFFKREVSLFECVLISLVKFILNEHKTACGVYSCHLRD